MIADDGTIQWRECPISLEDDRTTSRSLSGANPPFVAMIQTVHRQILTHIAGDLSCERAGLLFGCRTARQTDQGEEIFGTLVTASRPIMAAEASLTHFIMHPETWPSIWRESALENEEIGLAGWYHSHPGHGAFLSARDRRTQALWFRRSWQVAFVVDPVRREEAVFCGPRGVRAEFVMDAG